MELDVESLQYPAEEGDVRKAEAAGEEVPEHHCISLLRLQNGLAERRDFYPRRRKIRFLQHLRDRLLSNGGGAEIP